MNLLDKLPLETGSINTKCIPTLMLNHNNPSLIHKLIHTHIPINNTLTLDSSRSPLDTVPGQETNT